MSHLYPRNGILQGNFSTPPHHGVNVRGSTKPTPYQARLDIYSAYSTVEDKAKKLSAEASAEFNKASVVVQAKKGGIELYSGQYYAACTLGGLLACVS